MRLRTRLANVISLALVLIGLALVLAYVVWTILEW